MVQRCNGFQGRPFLEFGKLVFKRFNLAFDFLQGFAMSGNFCFLFFVTAAAVHQVSDGGGIQLFVKNSCGIPPGEANLAIV